MVKEQTESFFGFDNHENLCIEAPTGVGKTFAYLVPAFFHACQTDKPVVKGSVIRKKASL